jgi:hypothetical protein
MRVRQEFHPPDPVEPHDSPLPYKIARDHILAACAGAQTYGLQMFDPIGAACGTPRDS